MFKFELGAVVKVGNYSGPAKIIGRAEYLDRPNLYLVKYEKENGLPAEEWFDEDILN
ncbi:hypothetical protein [Acinetobacter sp. SA01]|jgi:hypothetical protein|uniref:hypothetical protein n=1 Tax=Acinetobacter sp. SA01 TaxID=1862567 RepID=UPI00140E8972|nr:hypothetical protein [Acinetobacter sp. SA01]